MEKEICKNCKGVGRVSIPAATHPAKCVACDGTGFVLKKSRPNLYDHIDSEIPEVLRAVYAMGHPETDFGSWSIERKNAYYRDLALITHVLKAIKNGKL